VTRRNAVSQVIGFMSLENGLVLAATGAKGMPLVVEISVAFSVLIAFIVIASSCSASANASTPSICGRLINSAESAMKPDAQALDQFRGERDDLRRAQRRAADPGAVGCVLAALPGYRLTSTLNVLATLATLLTSLSLFVVEPHRAPISWWTTSTGLIVLTTFVAFTPACSAPAISGTRSRSDGSSLLTCASITPCTVLMFAMTSRSPQQYRPDVGGDRACDAHTVLMVGIYRTHEALEAAWKYFISAASASRWRCSAPF